MPKTMTLPKALILVTVALILVVSAFSWGYLAHRNMFFPYKFVRNTAISIGLVNPGAPGDFDIFSRPFSESLALDSLGYVGGSYDDHPEISGVTLIERDLVFRGPRIYTSILSSSAFLIDIDGEVLHDWSVAAAEDWVYSHLLEDGDIVVVARDRSLLRVGRDSTVRWSVPVRAHHDLDVWNDTIVALTRKEELREEVNPGHRAILDAVSFYSLDGELLSEISLLDAIRASRFAYLVPSVRDLRLASDSPQRNLPLCSTHTNHVEVVDAAENWMGEPAGRTGLLISMRNINTIFLMDLESREILWAWGPNTLTYQHHPSLLSSGNVLVFNNGIDSSSVLEVNPRTLDIDWRYSEPDFFSATRGSAQRLPNGNTLITESNVGRVFEVTSKGDIVWDWKNPDVSEDGMRSAVFRMAALDHTPEWVN